MAAPAVSTRQKLLSLIEDIEIISKYGEMVANHVMHVTISILEALDRRKSTASHI